MLQVFRGQTYTVDKMGASGSFVRHRENEYSISLNCWIQEVHFFLLAAALFVFRAASTRAGVVSSDLPLGYLWLRWIQ